MATLNSSSIDDNGNFVMEIESEGDDTLTLATAGTYVDKNIMLNFNVGLELAEESDINALFST